MTLTVLTVRKVFPVFRITTAAKEILCVTFGEVFTVYQTGNIGSALPGRPGSRA